MDNLTEKIGPLLDGVYDCVDRIVLNGYFSSIQSPGGFRMWWSGMYGESTLDDNHLIRYSGRFSRRIRAYCSRTGIPVIHAKAKERNHELVAPHVPDDPKFRGVYCVVCGKAPGMVYSVQRSETKIRDISKERKYVNHYSFYIIDPDWGKIIVKICPHPPFNVNIILNGHEFVERQALKHGVSFTKESNCFTEVSDVAALSRRAESMTARGGVGRLGKVCDRWIYSSCLNFAVDRREQAELGLKYSYSISQLEFSRNLLFSRGRVMEEMFDGIVDRTRSALDIKTIKTIFGVKYRPCHRRNSKEKPVRIESMVETHTYDLTVFKVHFGKLTVKLYTKGEHVMRMEAVAHNVKDLKCRRSLEFFPEAVEKLRGVLVRFVNALEGLNACFVDDETLSSWPTPGKIGSSRVAGLDFNKPRIAATAAALLILAGRPRPFTASELAAEVRKIFPFHPEYSARNAGYDLKKFRAKGLVHRVGKTKKYQCAPAELKKINAFLVLRDKVIKPLLSRQGKIKRGPKGKLSELELSYEKMQREMTNIFKLVGIEPDLRKSA